MEFTVAMLYSKFKWSHASSNGAMHISTVASFNYKRRQRTSFKVVTVTKLKSSSKERKKSRDHSSSFSYSLNHMVIILLVRLVEWSWNRYVCSTVSARSSNQAVYKTWVLSGLLLFKPKPSSETFGNRRRGDVKVLSSNIHKTLLCSLLAFFLYSIICSFKLCKHLQLLAC